MRYFSGTCEFFKKDVQLLFSFLCSNMVTANKKEFMGFHPMNLSLKIRNYKRKCWNWVFGKIHEHSTLSWTLNISHTLTFNLPEPFSQFSCALRLNFEAVWFKQPPRLIDECRKSWTFKILNNRIREQSKSRTIEIANNRNREQSKSWTIEIVNNRNCEQPKSWTFKW